MLTEQGNIAISPTPANNLENYEWLRTKGIEYLQQFSGKLWTDFNVHDPGITILEILCYALTDLAYRTNLPVADLLTAKGTNGPSTKDYFTARKILTSHPVTIEDYRKLIIDRIPGIQNVWLLPMDEEPYQPNIYFDEKLKAVSLLSPPAGHQYFLLKIKGRYAVKLELEDYETIKAQHPHFLRTLAKNRNIGSLSRSVEATKSEYRQCLENCVRKLLNESRNFCEDFELVTVAGEELVALCADIELKPEANADKVFLQINNILFNYISPTLKFYSFAELVEKGKRTEEIFSGPAATRGFIDSNELEQHGHKDVLYVSDIISLLMELPEILQVKSIYLSSYRKKADGSFELLSDGQQYCLHLQDRINNVFRFALDVAEQDKSKIFNHIKFSKGLIYFVPNRLESYANLSFIDYPALPKNFENDLPVPQGNNRDTENYYSIQNDFPQCYYTGMDGIPTSETSLRKSQRLQLKAYLLFFDQLLADYLAGLNNLKNVFSWQGGTSASTLVPSVLNSNQIKDLGLLLKGEASSFTNTYTEYSSILESHQEQQQRRNLTLDHILARFNEVFVDYSLFRYEQNSALGELLSSSETIEDKIRFLQALPIITGKRSHAFNYTKKYLNTTNISGYQLRISKMLGLSGNTNKKLVKPINNIDYKAMLAEMLAGDSPTVSNTITVEDSRNAAFDSSFGFHILEHILLRPLYKKSTAKLERLVPLCGNKNQHLENECVIADKYSMQMTIVAPGWFNISSTAMFRTFTENLLRMEAPAHIAIKICWLDPAQMFLFEKTTDIFFKEMAKVKTPGTTANAGLIKDFNAALTDVNNMLSILKNTYLPSALDVCEQIDYNANPDEIKVPLILGHASLGGHSATDWYRWQPKEVIDEPSGFVHRAERLAPSISEKKKTEKPLSKPYNNAEVKRRKEPNNAGKKPIAKDSTENRQRGRKPKNEK